MADHIWIASTTAYDTAGNWNGGVPVSNGRAIVGTGSQFSMLTGVAQDGDDLDLFQVNEAFEGDVGSDGTPLRIAADIFNFFGRGQLHFQCHNGGAAVKTDILNIRCADPGGIFKVGAVSGAAGEIDEINISRGTGELTTVTGCDRLNVGYATNPASDVKLTINANCGTFALSRFNAGHTTGFAAMTAVHVGGVGRYIHGTLLGATPGALSALYLSANGYCEYNMAGTLALVYIDDDAVLDMTKTGHVKTITALVRSGRGRIIKNENTTVTKEYILGVS